MMLRFFLFSTILLVSYLGNSNPHRRQESKLQNHVNYLVGQPQIDTANFSKQFLLQLQNEYKVINIEGRNIIVSSHGEVKFPEILGPGIEYIYNGYRRNDDFRLVLTSLNQSDILFTFILSKAGKKIREYQDTVYFQPFINGFIRRFEDVKYGPVFQKKTASGIYKITIDDKNEYTTFEYTSFLDKDVADFQHSILDAPVLIKEGIEVPYAEYLLRAIERIQDCSNNLHKYGDDVNLQVSYKRSLNNFDILLSEIANKNTQYNIKEDTILLGIANFCELSWVADRLKSAGIAERKMVPASQVQEIPALQINNFHGSVFQTYSQKILSVRFENASRTINYKFRRDDPFIGEYRFMNEYSGPFQFYNYYFTILNNKGACNIITVWEKNKDNYRLVSILDKLMITDYGRVKIDTIIRLNKNRYILFLSFSGGDGGDVWGSNWIEIWNYPRRLTEIFRDNWIGDSESHEFSSCTLVDSKNFILTRKKIWYENSGENYIERDSTIRTARISIDSLMKAQKIN